MNPRHALLMGPMTGGDAVILAAARTPVGRGHADKGYFKDVHANELLGWSFESVLERAQVSGAEVEQVLAGCVQQLGEQSFNVARNAWLQAGLPVETPAVTIDMQCGSAQHAVNLGAALVGAGVHELVVAAGVEHMGHVPLFVGRKWADEVGTPYPPQLLAEHAIVDQGLAAEMIADHWQLSRHDLDLFALESHRRAAAATGEGRFAKEIIPVSVGGVTHDQDQGIRHDSSLAALGDLRPVFKPEGKITAGNASQISDGAAAVVLASTEKARQLGVEPLARIVDQATVGVDPVMMLTGPIPATKLILKRNRMTLADIDLIEINEAFASVVLAWERELQPDMDRVNVNGGAIAIGHPLGSTGARLITTLVHELERSDKTYGLVTMCCGGGIGTATLVERL